MSDSVILPEGYVSLMAVYSDGSAVVNTGITPVLATRIEADIELSPPAVGTEAFLFGAVPTTDCHYQLTYSQEKGFGCFASTASAYVTGVEAGRLQITFSGFTGASINGTTSGFLSLTEFSAGNLCLGSLGPYTTMLGYVGAAMKIYSFAIYDGLGSDAGLLRNFVPCKNEAGTAGLYDTVTATFYEGSFTETDGEDESEEVPVALAVTATVSDGVAKITWTGEEGDSEYVLYKNHLPLATAAETVYQDTLTSEDLEAYTCTLYRVSCTGQDGQEKEGEVRLLTGVSGDPLTDLITDRTMADVQAKNERGSYNARDLNRVAVACACVRDLLEELSYFVPEAPAACWTVNDIPTKQALDEHLETVKPFALLNCGVDPESLPKTMDCLLYKDANAIEALLLALLRGAKNIPSAWERCGDVECGGTW